jgi:hypothetical protein
MTLHKSRIVPALGVFLAATMMSGCGSDSTGPGHVDSITALQSLALGLQSMGGTGSLTTPDATNANAFASIGPLLDQVNVTIDGTSQVMFALGLRETFPPGTCQETIFIPPVPPIPGQCTPPALGTAVILWQTHSATQLPDRMIFIATDTGTLNLGLPSTPQAAVPAFAVYMEGGNNLWSSPSGSVTSRIAATSQTCNFPLPPYAKSGTCSIATFDEQGSIVLDPFSLALPGTPQKTIAIPHQILHGMWLAIGEVQPVPLIGATRLIPGLPETRQPMGLAPPITPAR